MQSVVKVLAFNGVEVGELLDEDERVLRVLTRQGEVVAVRSVAVMEHRPGLVRLICYSDGLHRWLA